MIIDRGDIGTTQAGRMGAGVFGAAEDMSVGEGANGGLVSGCGDGGVVAVGVWLGWLWHGFGGFRATAVGSWLGWEK